MIGDNLLADALPTDFLAADVAFCVAVLIIVCAAAIILTLRNLD